MGLADDTVELARLVGAGVKHSAKVGKDCLGYSGLAIVVLQYPLQFSFLMRIQNPWIIVKCEECVRIKFIIQSLGLVPFLQEYLHLLPQINILINCFIIEFIVRDSVFLWFATIRSVEEI